MLSQLNVAIWYHGLIVYFDLKRFARFGIYTSVMNAIVTEKKLSSLKRGGREFSSNFAFVRIFRKFLGCLVASYTVLFWKHCFNSLLLIFSRLRVNLLKSITGSVLNVLVKINFSKSLLLPNFSRHIIKYFRSVISFNKVFFWVHLICFLYYQL